MEAGAKKLRAANFNVSLLQKKLYQISHWEDNLGCSLTSFLRLIKANLTWNLQGNLGAGAATSIAFPLPKLSSAKIYGRRFFAKNISLRYLRF
jgi:hypothetical protein